MGDRLKKIDSNQLLHPVSLDFGIGVYIVHWKRGDLG